MSQVPNIHQCLEPLAQYIGGLDRRLTALETRPCCTASHAPLDEPSRQTPSSSSHASSPSSSPSASHTADPTTARPIPPEMVADIQAAAIRADPKRPKWLVDFVLPLPSGTERVWRDRDDELRAYPTHQIFRGNRWGAPGFAINEEDVKQHWSPAEVYHVPPIDQPQQTEQQPPQSPKIEREPAKVFKVLPPVEIEAHAQALGWTPESRVYRSIKVPNQVWVYPAAKFIWLEHGEVWGSLYKRETDIEDSCTLLPNRTVPADPLDQLAAEAQAEGEYGTAWEDLCKMTNWHPSSSPLWFDKDTINRFVADRERRAVEAAKSPKPLRPAGEVAEECCPKIRGALFQHVTADGYAKIKAIIAAAIERDRGSRP